jgi:sec-independent protein translocase protein TatA
MGSMSIWHWVIVAGIVTLLFSRGKISDLMGDVAKGIRAFKSGLADDGAPEQMAVRVPASAAGGEAPLALASSSVAGFADERKRG